MVDDARVAITFCGSEKLSILGHEAIQIPIHSAVEE